MKHTSISIAIFLLTESMYTSLRKEEKVSERTQVSYHPRKGAQQHTIHPSSE